MILFLLSSFCFAIFMGYMLAAPQPPQRVREVIFWSLPMVIATTIVSFNPSNIYLQLLYMLIFIVTLIFRNNIIK
jgi:hypothetical protein